MIKPKVGMYFYHPHGNMTGVWRYTSVSDNSNIAEHIKDFRTVDEAKKYVYEMNGWQLK